MGIPSSFEFDKSSNKYLEWGPVVDAATETLPAPTYLNDLTLTAALYEGRSDWNPIGQPGAKLIQWDVPYVNGSNAIYRRIITPADLNAIAIGKYVLVVIGRSASHYRDWERPAFVVGVS